MRLGTLSLIALLGTTTVAAAYDPYPFQRSDGKWGYVDDDHCWVIAANFDVATSFSDGLAAVKLKGKFGFIDETGEFAIPPEYQGVGAFSEGLAAVSIGNKHGYIDMSGKLLIPPQFELASPFSEGRASVRIGERWGFIDKSGRFVVNPIFFNALDYSNGRALVRKHKFNLGQGEFVYIDLNGQEVPAPVSVGATYEGGLKPEELNGKWGYVSASGEMAIDAQFDDANFFSGGRAAVRIGDNWALIDRTGRILLDPTCDQTR